MCSFVPLSAKVHFAEIAVKALYNGKEVSTALNAPDITKNTPKSIAWYYTAGDGINLQHTLLHKDLVGDIASI